VRYIQEIMNFCRKIIHSYFEGLINTAQRNRIDTFEIDLIVMHSVKQNFGYYCRKPSIQYKI